MVVDLDENVLAERFARRQLLPGYDERQEAGAGKRPVRRAAVLAPLLRENGAWSLLYIRRSDQLADHQGQVAFPGGGVEASDPSPEATALRETWEELGIEPKDVRVVGRLPGLLTGTGFSIQPVVGIIPWPYALRLSADEVAHAFTIPLSWLAEPAHREERWYERDGRRARVFFFAPYQGEVLWGATARMTVELLAILLDHPSS